VTLSGAVDDSRTSFMNGEIVHDYRRKRQTELEKTSDEMIQYFKNRKILVQPTGFAKAYNIAVNTLVTGVSAIQTFWTAASAQLSGLSGIALISSSPITIISALTLYGISLSYLECLSRGTFLMPCCHVETRTCLLPLKFSEITINVFFQPISTKLMGEASVINASDNILHGFGLDEKLALSLMAKAKVFKTPTI